MNGARTWALNRIRDRAGNVIDYRYTEDTGQQAFRIASIHYNANPTAGVAASHQVSFHYENRPNNEVDTGYVAGTPVRQVVRLDRIDVLYNGAVLRRYDLGYEPALSSGGRSRLASIQECGAGGVDCLARHDIRVAGRRTGILGGDVIPGAGSAVRRDRRAGQSWNLGRHQWRRSRDYLWAGGTHGRSATIRYRLGLGGRRLRTGNQFRNSCPQGHRRAVRQQWRWPRRPADDPSPAISRSSRGSPTGLGTPSINRDRHSRRACGTIRGADLNGDGLGDIAWSEATDPQVNSLIVRVRYALPAGGFAAPVTLYSQGKPSPTSNAEGGDFIGRPGCRIDLDGDGAEDLLMNENFSVARISDAGTRNRAIRQHLFTGGSSVRLQRRRLHRFCLQAHVGGILRVRVSGCTVMGAPTELQGPAWTGAAELHAHDWNGDGRDDLLLRGATNWLVALSSGDSLAPLADTGVPHEAQRGITGRDLDGDGCRTSLRVSASQVRLRLKTGRLPDLLLTATDGFGVSASFRTAR